MRTLISNIVGVAFVAAVPATAQASPADTIEVRLRYSEVVCGGYCPNIEIRVTPAGWITSKSLWHHGSTYRWKANGSQVDAFQSILATVRPSGDEQLDKSCHPSDLRGNPRPDDLAVRWIGVGSSASLTSCGGTHPPVRDVVERAIRALGVDLITGKKTPQT